MKRAPGLAELLEFQTNGQPVLSVYLDTDPAHHAKDQVRLTLKQLLEKFDSATIQRDAARVTRFLASEYDWQSRGLAVFASGRFWRVLPVPYRLTNFATVADKPYVRPLIDFALNETLGIVIVDRENARFFLLHLAEINEVARVWRATPSRHKQGGENTAARIQRHADTHINQNLKHAATQMVELFTNEHCAHIMIGGQVEEAALFRAFLPKYWQNLIIGEFAIDIDATPAQIRTKVTDLIDAANRKEQIELVKTVAEAARKRTPGGALGLTDTLSALEEKRVLTLIISEDFRADGFQCENCGHLSAIELKACPMCGHPLVRINHVIDLAIRKAMEMDSTVIAAHGDAAARLKRMGGVGALFRY